MALLGLACCSLAGSPCSTSGVVDVSSVVSLTLYVLTRIHTDPSRPAVELHVLDDSLDARDVTSVQCIRSAPAAMNVNRYNDLGCLSYYYYYLVASGDRLLMVMEHASTPVSCAELERTTSSLSVSETSRTTTPARSSTPACTA